MTRTRYLLVGLFFFVTIGILGYYTLFMTDFTLFGEKPTRTVYFAEAHGLREGDSVQVAGMRWGRVIDMTYNRMEADPELRIEVVMRLDEEIELREGFSIQIEDATLLGGRIVFIDPGPPDADPVPLDRPLLGTVKGNPLDLLGEFLGGEEGKFTRILDNADTIFNDMRAGRGLIGRLLTDDQMGHDLSAAMASASSSLHNVETITNRLIAGEGTIGALLTERDIYDSLNTVSERLANLLEDAGAVVADLRYGNGLLARAVHDEKMGDDVAATIEGLRSVVTRIQAGEGTLGQLVTDASIAENLSAILDGLARGEGTIGSLLKRDEVYEDLAQSLDDLAAVTQALRSGEGSLGKFVMDDELYREARNALGLITRSLEEFREAAPVTTFTSVLFGAF